MQECYIIKNANNFYKDEQEWEKIYTEGDKINYSKYKDPDANCLQFYEDLAMFLNVQECKVGGLNGIYIYRANRSYPYSIEVIKMLNGKKSKPIFYLKSDQFGFSAPSDKYNEHPYDTYLRLSEDKEKFKKVAKWLYFSRGIGGSFLWPMEINKNGKLNKNPRINTDRGGSNPYNKDRSYNNRYNRYWIEDRVDLTLLEIKRVLDYSSDEKISGSILWNCCLPETNLMKWLKHFGTFERYVKFFCFDSFVNDKNIPIDITSCKEDSILSMDKNLSKREEHSIYRLNSKVLDNMFEKLVFKIRQRSKDMKEKINNNV